jgi:hypothetical protein
MKAGIFTITRIADNVNDIRKLQNMSSKTLKQLNVKTKNSSHITIELKDHSGRKIVPCR